MYMIVGQYPSFKLIVDEANCTGRYVYYQVPHPEALSFTSNGYQVSHPKTHQVLLGRAVSTKNTSDPLQWTSNGISNLS